MTDGRMVFTLAGEGIKAALQGNARYATFKRDEAEV